MELVRHILLQVGKLEKLYKLMKLPLKMVRIKILTMRAMMKISVLEEFWIPAMESWSVLMILMPGEFYLNFIEKRVRYLRVLIT